MVLCIAYGKPDTVIATAVTEGLTAIVFRGVARHEAKTGKAAMTMKSNAQNYPAREV
jgi:hypothetical protein